MTNLFFIVIIMGILQAITEFLPVSSSGHLVIFQNLPYISDVFYSLGESTKVFFGVFLHVATLVAVVVYLWKDLIIITRGFLKGLFWFIMKQFRSHKTDFLSEEDKRGFLQGLNILIASIPAGVVGICFNEVFTVLFSKPHIALGLLIINGFILILTKKIPLKSRQIEEMGVIRSFIVGTFQALAMLPGISRSGMTIAGGLFNGMEPIAAAKFSFLMAIPAITGAGLLEGISACNGSIPSQIYLPLAISMLITVIIALVCLKVLFALVKRIRIDIFGYYTIVVGIIGLIIYYFN